MEKVGFVAKKEDLNGIQPLTPLTFSVLPAAMSWVFWQITTYMTGSRYQQIFDICYPRPPLMNRHAVDVVKFRVMLLHIA